MEGSGNLTETLIGTLSGNFDGKFNGSLDQKINKNFDGKGEYGEGEMKPRIGKGKRGGGNRNGEKGYKKVIIIFLFIRATPGTPASAS